MLGTKTALWYEKVMDQLPGTSGILDFFIAGGMVMYPLLICSLAIWYVIFERFWRFRKLKRDLHTFHLEVLNTLLRGDSSALHSLCANHLDLPTSRLLTIALDRLDTKDTRLQARWKEAVERGRQEVNQDLRQGLWVLGTIGAAAPFIGLFGTVVGILRSFGEIARSGQGGFAVVAAGISEALIATAAGICVAVIAVMAYNAFQTQWGRLVLLIRNQVQEIAELLEGETRTHES